MPLRHFLLEISVFCNLLRVALCQLTFFLQDDWDREAAPMRRGNFGVWEIILPANDGHPAIPHNTKVKVGHYIWLCCPVEKAYSIRFL